MAINPNTDFSVNQVLTASQQNRFPRGVMAYGVRTAGSYTATTTVGDVTGLSVSFSAVANRYYKIEAGFQTRKLGGSNYIEFLTTDAANNVLYDTFSTVNDNDYQEFHFGFVSTFAAGSTTLKIRCGVAGGTATIYGTTSNPSWLLVTDLGPA